MKNVYFYTPTLISYIDLISVGGSSKEGDESTIGQFHTGLKNAIALFMRNGIDVEFNVYNNSVKTTFKPQTFTKYCDETGKEKELIGFLKNDSEFIESTVSPRLGIDWELFMALREIYANMLDESGHYNMSPEPIQHGTEIVLSFEDGSEFSDIWNNRNLYINEEEPLYDLGQLQILENPTNHLRIYKQNMLVHEDPDEVSIFSYNIKFGELDDRRKLRDASTELSLIVNKIGGTNNLDFIKAVVSTDPLFKNDCLVNYSTWTVSDTFKKYIEDFANEHGSVETFPSIIKYLKTQRSCQLPGRKLRTIEDSIYSSSKTVEVDMTPKQIIDKVEEKEVSLKDEIESLYNISIECDVIYGSIKGSSCVADKYNNVLILKEDFDLEKDFPEFIVQYLDLTVGGNIITSLSKMIVNLIRK